MAKFKCPSCGDEKTVGLFIGAQECNKCGTEMVRIDIALPQAKSLALSEDEDPVQEVIDDEEESSDSDTESYQIVRSSKSLKSREISSLDVLQYTSGMGLAQKYRTLIETLPCVHIEDFGFMRLSCGDGLAWLSPYTGNQHNRCLFVQLALAATMRFSVTESYASTLFEAFMGSGQVSLNYHWCTGLFGSPKVRVRAGDINIPLCCAWSAICTDDNFIEIYLTYAKAWDSNIKVSYPDLKDGINELIACLVHRRVVGNALKKRLAPYVLDWDWQDELESASESESSDEDEDPFNYDVESSLSRLIAVIYVYLNNRCTLGTTFNLSTKKLSATLRALSKSDLEGLRKNERDRLGVVTAFKGVMALDFEKRDFAETTEEAGLGDLVVFDCPFPKYTITIPDKGQSDAKELAAWTKITVEKALLHCKGLSSSTSMEGGKMYGIDDGASLQLRILGDVVAKLQAGASVLLCNYATPELMLWYSKVFAAFYKETVPIYLLKRPGKGEELYLLMVLPGKNVLKKHESVRDFLAKRITGPYDVLSRELRAKSTISKEEAQLLLKKAWKD